jgi:hypothetical protein
MRFASIMMVEAARTLIGPGRSRNEVQDQNNVCINKITQNGQAYAKLQSSHINPGGGGVQEPKRHAREQYKLVRINLNKENKETLLARMFC